MELVNGIPRMSPVHQKLKGDVEINEGIVTVGGIEVPRGLTKRFERLCKQYDTIQDAVEDKQMFLRGKLEGRDFIPFGVVSSKFVDLTMDAITQAFGQLDGSPTVRYCSDKERFIANYHVTEIARPEGSSVSLNLFVDSGDFGKYGGNGQCAVKIGVATYDISCTNWTQFLEDNLIGRIIHRDSTDVNTLTERLHGFAREVAQEWEASADRSYSRGDIAEFAEHYGAKLSAKRVFDRVMDKTDGSTSGYDLAWHLTKEAQGVADTTRVRLERLAGDVIMQNAEYLA